MQEAFVALRDKRSIYVSEGVQDFCELLTRKVDEIVSMVRSSVLRGEVPLPNRDASSRSDWCWALDSSKFTHRREFMR